MNTSLDAALTAARTSFRVYSWTGHGNLGDDWLYDVATQYVDSRPTRERRSPLRLGAHRLDPGPGCGQPLLLWGGGWLAADRPGSRTLRRWARHLALEDRPVAGIGLGLGPFDAATAGDHAGLDTILRHVGSLSVRTERDLELLPRGRAALLGCDPALLDHRFAGTPEMAPSGPGFVVLTAPAWRNHWLTTRPWLTEDSYRRYVEAAVNTPGLPLHQIVFDRSEGGADERYWRHLGGTVRRPQSVDEAADLFRSASYVVAGRLHAALLAAVLQRPAAVVGYHHKFDAVSELGVSVAGRDDVLRTAIRFTTASAQVIEQVRARGRAALSAQLAGCA